jgi:SAM-dependent methyltransferase
MERRAQEIERIRAAYRERDASGSPVSSPWLDPAYRFQLQEIEWALLGGLAAAGVELQGARVAEVGCGAGYFLSRFLDYGAGHASGIDLMDDRVARARERDPRLDVVAGDASELPWGDGTFDVVSQFTCLSSVLDHEVRRAIASEMWRVLAPGGALVSYDVRPDSVPIRVLRRLAALRGGAGGSTGTPIAPVRVSELESWFAGTLRARPVGIYPELASKLARFPLLMRATARCPGLQIHTLAVATKPGAAAPGRDDPASRAADAGPPSP